MNFDVRSDDPSIKDEAESFGAAKLSEELRAQLDNHPAEETEFEQQKGHFYSLFAGVPVFGPPPIPVPFCAGALDNIYYRVHVAKGCGKDSPQTGTLEEAQKLCNELPQCRAFDINETESTTDIGTYRLCMHTLPLTNKEYDTQKHGSGADNLGLFPSAKLC